MRHQAAGTEGWKHRLDSVALRLEVSLQQGGVCAHMGREGTELQGGSSLAAMEAESAPPQFRLAS